MPDDAAEDDTPVCEHCDGPEDECNLCDNCGECEDSSCDCCSDCGCMYCECCGTCGYAGDSCECCSECGRESDHYCSDCGDYYCGYTECPCHDGPLLGYGSVPDQVLFRRIMLHGVPFDYSRDTSGSRYPIAPDDAPYLGLEIEAEVPYGEVSEIVDIWQASGLGWSSYDGSLSNGAECKTHPSTYEFLAQSELASVLRNMGERGARAWNYPSTGLHIHVSKLAFASKSHMWKFAHVHSKCFVDELVTMAGREGHTEYCRFPHETDSKAYLIDSRTGDCLYDRHNRVQYVPETPTRIIAGKVYKNNRSVAVNVNEDTIELRYWKGSLHPRQVLGAAAVETALIDYTRGLTVADVNACPDWDHFVTWSTANLPMGQLLHISELAAARGVSFSCKTKTLRKGN